MENVRHYPLLDAAEQEKIRTAVQIMVAEKNWEGCGGLEMTDKVRVTVAAQAGLLLLGVDRRYVFDNVVSILVYPDAFVTDMYMETFGEAWPRGPIILSWRHVMQGGADPADGLNLVLHEFAHQIDGLDGEMEGTPPLVGGDRLHRWRDVATREYHRLVKRAERGKATLLNHYGASNEAEFFAVATECFYEQPLAMRKKHRELYDVFRDFYRVDPRRWFADAPELQAPLPPIGGPRGDDEPGRLESLGLDTGTADASFARGVLELGQGENELALEAFDEAARLSPADAEIRHHRARALFELGRFDEAERDAAHAIALDPNDTEAYRIRGLARDERGDEEEALADWNRVLADLPEDAEAYFRRGCAHAELGHSKQAIKDLTEAISCAKDWAEPFRERAAVWADLGEEERAAEDRAAADLLDPDHAEEH